jgi:hypothetical protein
VWRGSVFRGFDERGAEGLPVRSALRGAGDSPLTAGAGAAVCGSVPSADGGV